MITAKEIHRKKFEKVKFGYSPEDVDAFMAQLEADVRLMEQEITASGEKISLLADKVREYKETEDDLRNALIGAQKQAREVIEAANQKAAQIEEEARQQVGAVQQRTIAEQEAQIKALSEQLARENESLVTTQRQVAAFKQSLFDMYKAHLSLISKLPDTVGTPAAKPADKPAEDAKPADKPAEDAKPAEKPAEDAKPAEKPAEDAKPAEEPAKPEEKPADAAPAPEKPEDKPSVSGAETVTADPFAGESRRKSSPESRFGSRRDDKKKRS